jgi:hypothetical protein
MTTPIRLPDGPVTEGSYPDGSSWRMVGLDNDKARVVSYSSKPGYVSLMFREYDGSYKSQGYTPHIKDFLQYLLKKDRALLKETMAWFDSHFSEDELRYLVSNQYDYSYSDKSWMYLITHVKFATLGYFKRWFEEQIDSCWIDNGYALQVHNEDNSVECLRFYYEDDNTSVVISYSHRSYYKDCLAQEVWRVNNIEDLGRLLTCESKTAGMFRKLKHYDHLTRGLNATS